MNNITYNVRGWLVYEVDTDGDTLLHYQGTRTAFDSDLDSQTVTPGPGTISSRLSPLP